MAELMTPVITPFDASNRINYASLKRLIDHLYQTKTKRVVLNSFFSEGFALTSSEKRKVIEKSLSYVGERMGVDVFVDSSCLVQLKEKLYSLNDTKVNRYILALPFTSPVSGDEFNDYLSTIDRLTKKPFIIDLSMGFSSVFGGINPMEIHPNVTWFRGWIVNNHDQVKAFKKDKTVKVYSTLHRDFIDSIREGVEGIYTSISHLYGETLHTLIQLIKSNLFEETLLMMDIYEERFNALQDGHPVIIKGVLNHLGFNVGEPRLPLKGLKKEGLASLKASLRI